MSLQGGLGSAVVVLLVVGIVEHLLQFDFFLLTRLHQENLGADFVQCVKTRATTVGPIDSAVYSDIISHIADIAIRLKRPVKWDPAKEKIVGDEQASRMLSRAIRPPWRI